ncbi:MAG: V-type ATPase 116kDa subunit family protein [Myxococcaceae bacterium]
MIVQMTRVRLAGPGNRLEAVLAFVQNLGLLHVVRPELPGASGAGLVVPGAQTRAARHCRRLLDDVEGALTLLGLGVPRLAPRAPRSVAEAARFARRTRRAAARLERHRAALDDERVMLLRYREFFTAFEALVGHELTWPDGQAFYVVLRAGALTAVAELRRALARAVGEEVELLDRPLPSGEIAVLILAPSAGAQKVARLLSESRVQELPAPPGLGEKNLLRALPALKARIAELPRELEANEAERRRLADAVRQRLAELAVWLHDQLLMLDARAQVHAGKYLFVLEGWVPQTERERLQQRVAAELGPEIVVEFLGSEQWRGESAPVALTNPPLFRPFELVTRMLPLPRYGTIDPTPFVAIFFPMFFGLMLGDVGYGALLAGLAVLLRFKSTPGTRLRAVAAVAGACAAFAIIFGVLFGELFGTLGHAWGMRPLWFNREEAIVPFLTLAVALGVVHVTLGLVLAVVTSWRRGHRREALGRGVAALMVVLTVVALLAAFEQLPAGLVTPSVIGLLVAFVALIALEGIVAVVELLSTWGHVLSYARIMALGTASLMLAVVANRMVGAMGSVVVGVVFALLFHLVNFAIGLFSPTIHALRLHYVEFFGKFFSPGGTEYRPLAHWQQ